MALPPLAPVSDLADWVGQEIPDADPRAGAVLSAASAIVRSYVGLTWVDEDTSQLADVPDDVAAVVVQVAARVWVNPSGATYRVSGPLAEQLGKERSQGLYLTETEREILATYRSSPADIGTLSVTTGTVGDPTIYVPTGPPPAGYPFPWYSADDPMLQ